jgi:enoyl-CoA hydratase
MSYENILFEADGPVAMITINREKLRNALNGATLAEIGAALEHVERDDGLRVAIITGAGEKAFAAGADINELRALPGANAARLLAERGHQVGLSIARMRKIVIAAVNGFALGGGCELAMGCDIRLAAASARFGQPEINLGLIPGWGGTQRLTRLAGPGMSKLLNLTGDMIGADEALRIGLVERVYPDAELLEAARAGAPDRIQGAAGGRRDQAGDRARPGYGAGRRLYVRGRAVWCDRLQRRRQGGHRRVFGETRS